MLYTEADLEASMDKIETINFHEEKDVLGVKFWAYNAGHVLGAAMFMLEIAGVKVIVFYYPFLSIFHISTFSIIFSIRFCTPVIFPAKKTGI